MSNIIEITDLHHEAISIYSQLTEAQLRNKLEPHKGIFIAESPKVIKVALEQGFSPLSILTERKHITGQAQEIISLCGDIPIYTGASELLTQITGYELTRGVLCAMQRPPEKSLEEICQSHNRIVVIDGVVNATNIGAIFRAAASLGMDAILLTRTCCDPWNRRSVRVSMGTVFQIPWTYIGGSFKDWPEPGIRQLKELGYTLVAMALSDNAISIADARLKQASRLAIVLGTEGDGLSKATIERCDFVAKIPMQKGVDSLNVAAASAVAFWELTKE